MQEFYLDDKDLGYPLKPQTVPTPMLLIVSFAIPALIIVVVDVALPKRPKPVAFTANRILWIVLGLLVTIVATNTIKVAAGRHRPDFLARCRPDPARVESVLRGNSVAVSVGQGGIGAVIMQKPVTAAEVCSTLGTRELEDGAHSFPSGHSSISAFGSVFGALYLQQAVRAGPGGPVSLVMILQLLCLLWGMVVAATRYANDYHFGSDIFAGSLLGSTVAAWVAWRLLRAGRPPTPRSGELPDAERGVPDSGTSQLRRIGAADDAIIGATRSAFVGVDELMLGESAGAASGPTVLGRAACDSAVGIWEPSRLGRCLHVRRLTPREFTHGGGQMCALCCRKSSPHDGVAASLHNVVIET